MFKFRIDGQEYEAADKVWTKRRGYDLNETVILYYNPAKPEAIFVLNVSIILKTALIWLVPGLVFIWMSVKLFTAN